MAFECAKKVFPEYPKKILAGLKAFTKFMKRHFKCKTSTVPPNEDIEAILEDVVGYELPDESHKQHLFMDIFVQFTINFIKFGPGE